MKHQKSGRQFGRNSNQRRALLKTMIGSLIACGKITTTLAKAKEVKSLVDRLIGIAKQTQLAEKKISTIRLLQRRLPLGTVSTLCTEDFLKRFEGRSSGYARVTKLGKRRSDSAPMAVIEFV